MIQQVEVDQSCGTDDNWNTSLPPCSFDMNISDLPEVSPTNGLLVLKSQQRSNSKQSSDVEGLPGDSMVSFDVQPMIQSTYKTNAEEALLPNSFRGTSKGGVLTNDQSVEATADFQTAPQPRLGNRALKSQARQDSSIGLVCTTPSAGRVASQGNNNVKRGHLVKGNPTSNGPIATVIKNGQPVLVTKAKMSSSRMS